MGAQLDDMSLCDVSGKGGGWRRLKRVAQLAPQEMECTGKVAVVAL